MFRRCSFVYVKNFLYCILDLRDYYYKGIREKSMTESQAKALKEIYNSVYDFVLSGSYTSIKIGSKVIRYTLLGKKDKEIAPLMGKDEHRIREARKKISDTLYSIYGYDFFDLIYEGNYDECNKRIFLVGELSKKPVDYVPLDIIDVVGSRECKSTYDIVDCFDEVNFLVSNCRASIERQLAYLDMDKLCYLIKVLEGRKGTLSDKYDLVKLLI